MKKKTKRSFVKFNFRLVVVLLVGELFLLVVSSINSASKGSKLIILEQALSEIEDQNRHLRASLINQASLRNLKENSQNLGFVEPENIIYLDSKEPVAKTK